MNTQDFMNTLYDVLAQNQVGQSERDEITEVIDHLDLDRNAIVFRLSTGHEFELQLVEKKARCKMKLFTIYYTNVMQHEDHEVVASEERPTKEEALAYLIKNEAVSEHYDDGIEVYPTYITDMDGNEVTVKVEEVAMKTTIQDIKPIFNNIRYGYGVYTKDLRVTHGLKH